MRPSEHIMVFLQRVDELFLMLFREVKADFNILVGSSMLTLERVSSSTRILCFSSLGILGSKGTSSSPIDSYCVSSSTLVLKHSLCPFFISESPYSFSYWHVCKAFWQASFRYLMNAPLLRQTMIGYGDNHF